MTRVLLVFILVFLLIPVPSFAAVQNCTVAWNARTDADLAGYTIAWGTVSGTYPNTRTLSITTTTTCAALGITAAGTYYLVIRYFDTSGNQSAYTASPVSATLATVITPPTTPTITSLSPLSGVVGTPVTIIGTNFSSTLSSNTVKFNGVTATLSSGSTTQLVAVVPSSATTGKVSVTTSAGTVNSSSDFTISTVPPSDVYDSVTDFSGIQGPVWYYLNGDYSEMIYSSFWNGAELYQGIWDTGMHPGHGGSNSIRRWVCPAAGVWNVSGITGDYDMAGGDGVVVSAVSNLATTLFSRTINNGDGDSTYAFNYTCALGDTLDFTVDGIGNVTNDSTHFEAHIAGSVTPPPPPPTPTPPPSPTPSPPSTVTLSSMTTLTPAFNIALTATVTIVLSTVASTDTTVLVTSADPTILSAPTTVTIPANSLSADFTVLGLSAGSTQLTASLNASSVILIVTVQPTTALTGVTLLSPADRSTLSSHVKFVILRWRAVRGATTYIVKVHDDTISTDNTSVVCPGYIACALTTTSSSYAFKPRHGHTYTWTVTWTDSGGHTSNPVSWTFAQEMP